MALWITDSDGPELRPNATETELQVIIAAAYKQVWGNVHVLESDRLTTAESHLRNGDITVRGFVKALAQSDRYRALFFEDKPIYRCIELNFKHLLGRAPEAQSEIAEHVVILNTQGYEAEINSYLNSDEYQDTFGENCVPSYQTTSRVNGTNAGFKRTFNLVGGWATSDRGKSAQLVGELGTNLSTKVSFPSQGFTPENSRIKRFRIAICNAKFGSRVTRTKTTFEVSYNQLSQKIQNIQKTGGKILSVTEVF
jgi:phycoerythrin-associated linker protein